MNYRTLDSPPKEWREALYRSVERATTYAKLSLTTITRERKISFSDRDRDDTGVIPDEPVARTPYAETGAICCSE